jgi:hypothetical protein
VLGELLDIGTARYLTTSLLLSQHGLIEPYDALSADRRTMSRVGPSVAAIER